MASRRSKKRKVDAQVQLFMQLIDETPSTSTATNGTDLGQPEISAECDSIELRPAVAMNHITETQVVCVTDSTRPQELTNIVLSACDGYDHKEMNENVPQDDLSVTDDGNYMYSTSEFDEFSSNESIETDGVSSSEIEDCSESVKPVDDLSSLEQDLCEWAVEYNVTHSALCSLLHILQKRIKSLPKDSRTLLKTSTVVPKNISGGEYCHIGIEKGILNTICCYGSSCTEGATVALQVNVDGLPLFKSSSKQLWPILGRIGNIDELFVAAKLKNSDPFVIGVYYGNSKPTDVADYLMEFVQEANSLYNVGIVHKHGCSHAFKISAFICDMPARSFIKCVKGHGAYGGCDRCTQRGVYEGKVVYPQCDAPLRTDDSFRAMTDEKHHIKESPLASLPIGMVSNFVIDYMHLVCLGVVRKLISLWLTGPLKTRLGPLSRKEINEKMMSYTVNVPDEFARKPRVVSEFERWKATEFRMFVLYTGPVCLLDSLPVELYNNFMLLSVATTLLLSPKLCKTYADYSHELLVLFVKHFSDVYGQDKVTYNVHALIHVSDDAKLYGALDNVSAFAFENYLGKLKRLVRKPNSVLQQVVCRLSEARQVHQEKDKSARNVDRLIVKQVHYVGPVVCEIDVQHQYKVLETQNFKVKLTPADRFVKLRNGDVVAVQNIVANKNDDIFIIYRKFHNSCSFFSYPLPSTELGIFKFGNLGHSLHHCNATDVDEKYLVLPYKSSHIAFPVLHSTY